MTFVWNRTADDVFWLSASRAVRTPSRGERDAFYDALSFPGPNGSIIVAQNQGTTEFVAERLQAYEAGYRRSITPRLSLDVAGFHNRYLGNANFREGEPYVRSASPLTIVVPVFLTNLTNLSYHGAEVTTMWSPFHRGQLRLNYAWLGGAKDDPFSTFITRGPSRQLHARWYWNLPRNLQWDSSYFFFNSYLNVPAYHRVDSRLGWRPHPHWEVSVTAQHLLDNQHREAPLSPYLEQPAEVGRSVYGKLTWRF